MQRRHRPLLLLVLVLTLVGCTPDATDDAPGVSTAIGDEPLSDDEATLHMMGAPELPAELDGAEVVESELRAPDLTERNIIQLVEVPSGVAAVAAAPEPGALYRVAAGATLEVGAGIDFAALTEPAEGEDGPAELGPVTAGCAAPCAVTGPALVSPAGWLEGFGAASGWLLLVPSPIG